MSIVKNKPLLVTKNRIVYIELNGYGDSDGHEKHIVSMLCQHGTLQELLQRLSTTIDPPRDHHFSLINRYIHHDGGKRVTLFTLRNIYLSNGYLRDFDYQPIPNYRLLGSVLLKRCVSSINERLTADLPMFDISYYYDFDEKRRTTIYLYN